ncbi:M4 family metallopeptidase [Streptomyces sp. VRA16 Mangrove soil]|uniref:M4 family metallopeptidase n=1 Tax=Streptomyces sp. VRA16 Mangrove soil TaxID=2817434 RepID=UPI001A9DAB11|nr:M4 family metallopeptidase [Streptomyces sp. VRA16 Mangrove soil]MBO1335469.1 M4 family metallopeptidase [Streptomyces sp. VRA16 Mangrove soil]
MSRQLNRSRRTPRGLLLAAATLTVSLATLASPALAAPADAQARIFMVNPVQSSGDQTLTDAKDAASAVPDTAYALATLRNLDAGGGLSGTWADVRSNTGSAAKVADAASYTRHDDQFEQVMAYFWVNEAQEYLQSLGFGTELPGANDRAQPVRIDQWGADNSFFTDKKAEIRFGKGGVDDAEDAEVIVHEYGHAVHNAQVPGFGTSEEAGSIGEAFGDYLAVEVGAAADAKYGWPMRTDLACVADWDSVSYTNTTPHCLRRLDTDKTYADKAGEVHADGEIWSRALFDIRTALGPKAADRIIVNAQFGFAPDTSFSAAATQTIATAQDMYGSAAARTVRKAFADRGIPGV